METTSVHSGEDVLPVGVVDVDGCVVVSTDCCGAGGEHVGEVIADSAEVDATNCKGVIGGNVELWDDLQRSEEMVRRVGTNLAVVVVEINVCSNDLLQWQQGIRSGIHRFGHT